MRYEENWIIESEWIANNLLAQVEIRDTVVIWRNGRKVTGRAIGKLKSGHWLLSLVREHGRPRFTYDIATRENICEVKKRGRS